MSWFESRSKKEQKTAAMNLLAVMGADRQVTSAEEAFFKAACGRIGISQKDLADIHSDLSKGKVNFVVAKDQKERVRQMIDMIFMMMVDGKIDQREMDICTSIGARLGFNPSGIRILVDKIVDAINKGNSEAQIIKVAESTT
jgi:uncharacterized tellurite resistance protein B-like protein